MLLLLEQRGVWVWNLHITALTLFILVMSLVERDVLFRACAGAEYSCSAVLPVRVKVRLLSVTNTATPHLRGPSLLPDQLSRRVFLMKSLSVAPHRQKPQCPPSCRL